MKSHVSVFRIYNDHVHILGAHGRFFCLDKGQWVRQSRIQTLEPDNWMYEVDKFGHATRKIVKQTLQDR